MFISVCCVYFMFPNDIHVLSCIVYLQQYIVKKISQFLPLSLKWTLPSVNSGMTIIANWLQVC